jgi:FkbM family methyltransferase
MGHNSVVNYMAFAKIFGLKNLALFHCKNWALCNLPIFLPIFNMISHKEELQNIRNNILQGYVRDRSIERQIRKAKHPIIVDCGINVGVTVRWWFYLNPKATVYGIDMMQEANDFTIHSLPERFKLKYVPITTALASETGRMIEVKYDDPLFGGNSVDASDKHYGNRQVRSMTLDDCLHNYSIDSIDFLKVDIENSGVSMFQGAAWTLSKVKSILLARTLSVYCAKKVFISERRINDTYGLRRWLKIRQR